MCNRGGEFKRRRESPARPVLGFAFPEILFGLTCLGGKRKVSPPRLQALCESAARQAQQAASRTDRPWFLHQDCQKRWISYRLPKNLEHKDTRSSHSIQDSSHSGDSLHKPTVDSSHQLENVTREELATLKEPAVPVLRRQDIHRRAASPLEPNRSRSWCLDAGRQDEVDRATGI
jgi:hypothetical protein